MHRRHFLAASGAATLTMPGFLSACSKSSAPLDLAGAPPADPFQEWYGIDASTVRAVLAELGAGGADFGDLYLSLIHI